MVFYEKLNMNWFGRGSSNFITILIDFYVQFNTKWFGGEGPNTISIIIAFYSNINECTHMFKQNAVGYQKKHNTTTSRMFSNLWGQESSELGVSAIVQNCCWLCFFVHYKLLIANTGFAKGIH
jgi:hypothetical protein